MKFALLSALLLSIGTASTCVKCNKKQKESAPVNLDDVNYPDDQIRFNTQFQNSNSQIEILEQRPVINVRSKRTLDRDLGNQSTTFMKNTQQVSDPLQIIANYQKLRNRNSDLQQVKDLYRQSSVQVLNEASKNYGSARGSFNNLFVRFPTCSQLDKLIISADSVAIIKTIQKVASDNTVSCQARINYLMQLLGRLRTAIQKKVRLADQLKIVITSAENQINRLVQQTTILRKSLDGIGLDSLKEDQRRLNRQLQSKYQQLNASQSQTPVLKAKLLGIEKQIQILIKNNQVERSKIASDKLELTKVNSDISNIQTKLRQLQDRQAVLRESINRGTNLVGQNENNIIVLRKKIEETQLQLKKYKDGYDQANLVVKDLQLKVQRLRSNISVGQSKKDKYTRQIAILEQKINTEKKKAFPDNQKKLEEMIKTLKDLIPSVQKSIDSHYYNCYGAGSNIKVDSTGNVIVYLISGDRFGDYIRNLYGQSIKFANTPNEISLNKINIFSPDWSEAYGYPFLDNAFGSQDFSFSGSFSCLNNSNSVNKGWGVIKNIGNNFIEAEDQKGNNQRFNIGSCSRLQSTNKIPKVGQKFYWSGVIGSKGYNLFSGSCFE